MISKKKKSAKSKFPASDSSADQGMDISFDLGLGKVVLRADFFDDAFDIPDIIRKHFQIHPRLQPLPQNLLSVNDKNLKIVGIPVLKINLIGRRAMIQRLLELGVDLHPDNQILLNHPIRNNHN